VASERVRGTADWIKMRIDPTAPSLDSAEYAVGGLHLDANGRADMPRSAVFADIWVGRLPRMTLKTDRRDNVYVDPARPKISCVASGFAAENSRVVFQLVDLSGAVIATEEKQLVVTSKAA